MGRSIKRERRLESPERSHRARSEDYSGRGLPTFGECTLRHEERVNGGRLCLPLAAKATSVSIAPLLHCHCTN